MIATKTKPALRHDQPAPLVSLCKSCVNCTQALAYCDQFEQQTTTLRTGYYIVLACEGYSREEATTNE